MGDFSDIVSVYEGGVRLVIKAKPGASRPRPPRIVDLAEGKRAVEVAVASVAEDGKANKAILEALAKEIGIKKNILDIKVGASGRVKVVEIHGDKDLLGAQVIAWLKGL